MKDVFSVSNYSVVEDNENYYFFRCLEDIDLDYINKGKITITDGSLDKLITYRERYNETHITPSNFKEDSEISLEEMWSHIKKNFFPGTNCISFSTNCNVSVDYDYGESKYLMIKVPKNGLDNVYFAGEYMLSELDKYLNNVISTISKLDEVYPLIKKIKEADSSDKIVSIISEVLKNTNNPEFQYVLQRFDKKQFFNYDQQLEYNRIIGKLTVLELFGKVDNILTRTNKNTSLISTISMANSSGEVILYKDRLPENKMVSKTIIDLFSILQQAEDKGINKDNINILKNKVLELAKSGYDLKDDNGILYFGNDKDSISLGKTSESVLFNEKQMDLSKDISVKEAYNITYGCVPYVKAKDAVDFAVNTAVSKVKLYELCNILNKISPELSETIDSVLKASYPINSKIINRRNNSGIKLCESVNIDMNKTSKKVYNSDELFRMLSYINVLSKDNLLTLISTNGLSIEKTLCDSILDKSNKVGINRYYAETIIDQINFESIFGDDRELKESEREILVTHLEQVNCSKIYDALNKVVKDREKISKYIFNLMIEDGYKGYSFKELCDLDNLDELISLNINNLNSKLSAIKVDKALGIVDNENYVNDSQINLRDYQQDAIDNIDATFRTKRFTGVVLPTGAGKSFVAMAEMLKFKDKNIVYYAPNTGILAQVKKHILRNIVGFNVITDKEKNKLISDGKEIPKGTVTLSEADEIIKSIFPHLKFYCYQGLTTKDEEIFKMYDADLIVFDELHRTGAEEWNHRVKKLIKNNPNAKMLGITATPIRDDASHKDMMLEFAKLSGDYSEKELIEKRYLSSELYLTDAMQEGIVVIPNLITFDYNLAESQEFKEIEVMRKNVTDEEEKKALENTYNEMLDIVRKSKKEGIDNIVSEAFQKNMKRKNGKYIIFLPMNTTGLPTEEYIKNYMEEVKKYFSSIDGNPEMSFLLSNRTDGKDNTEVIENFEEESDHLKLIFSLNMLNEGVHIDGVDGIMMLRPIGADAKILYKQQIGRVIHALLPNVDFTQKDAPLIFDVYNNYIAHNMDREANKSNTTSDLQKMRSADKWINKHGGYFPDINSENVTEYRKAATLKKLQLKYKRYLDNHINKNATPTEIFEIEEIINIGKTIGLWEREIGDRISDDLDDKVDIRVNAFKAVGEQKRFIDLYKEAKQKTKSASRANVGALRIRNAISTLELLSEYGLDINNETVKLNTKLTDILNSFDKDVSIAIKEELQVPLDYNLGVEYNYVKEMFNNRHGCFNEYSIRSLRNSGVFHSYINIKGEEKSFVNENGFIIKGPSDFIHYNIYTGTKYDNNGYDIDGYDENYFKPNETYNKFGFDKDGIHIKTKTFLNPYGFDISGNYYELDDTGTYINLGKFDRKGFDINHLWYKKTINKNTGEVKYTYKGTKYDDEGFNFLGLNKYGFDRDGYYWEIDKSYVRQESDEENFEKRYKTDNKRNDRGFDKDGIHINGTKYGDDEFDIEGKYLDGRLYNKYGFNYLHKTRRGMDYDDRGFNFYGVNRYTNKKYDEYKFDRDGYYWRLGEDGEYHKTFDKYDEYFFDCDGYFYEKDENGVYQRTNRKIDNRQFDRDGYYWRLGEDGKYHSTIYKYDDNYFDRDGYFYEEFDGKIQRTDKKYNKYGFDVEGYYWSKSAVSYTRIKTPRKYDFRGFMFDKTNKDTGELWDENGFDIDSSIDCIRDANNFGKDGYYWKYDYQKGKYEKTDSKYNEKGFNKEKENKDTGELWDENGLDILDSFSTIASANYFGKDGYYWKKERGKYKKTDKKHNERGFDVNNINIYTNEEWDNWGYDVNKQRRKYIKSLAEQFDGIICINTKTYWNENGLDVQGTTDSYVAHKGFDDENNYWGITEDGVYYNTHKPYNERFFDKRGHFYKVNEDGSYIDTGSYVNEYGFNKNGIFVKTGEKYNYDYFDWDRINKYTNDFYNEDGFDIDHLTREGKLYNKYGFNYKYIHKNGTMYDDRNFDFKGINKYTLKKYDEYFRDRDKNYVEEHDEGYRSVPCDNEYGEAFINDRNFDILGYYYALSDKTNKYINTGYKHDERNFDVNKINVVTGKRFDELFFDVDGVYVNGNLYDYKYFDANGYYYEEDASGNRIKTDRKYDDRGFDREGYYWKLNENGVREKTDDKYDLDGIDSYGFNKDGINIRTNLPYDEYLFDASGKHIFYGNVDENGFNRDGIYLTGLKENNLGFNRDGINKNTNSEYDENNFDIYHNKKISSEYQLSRSIEIAKKYIEGNVTKKGLVLKYKSLCKNKDDEKVLEFIEKNIFMAVKTNPLLDKKMMEKVVSNIEKYEKLLNKLYEFVDEDEINNENIKELYYSVLKLYNDIVDDIKFINLRKFKFNVLPPKVNGFNINCDYRGFDKDGFYWKKLDDGTFVKTDKKFNKDGFDKDGNFWALKEDGIYFNTENKYNLSGVNCDGFNKENIYIKTGLKYNEHLFNANGFHIYCGKYDENGFDKDGINADTGSFLNNRYFNRDGINIITGTRYDEDGLDIYGNPKDLDDKDLPWEVTIAKRYIEGTAKKTDLVIEMSNKKHLLKNSSVLEKEFNKIVYIGVKMYPKLKDRVLEKIDKYQNDLVKKQFKLVMLKKSKSATEKEIIKAKKVIKTYEDVIERFNSLK